MFNNKVLTLNKNSTMEYSIKDMERLSGVKAHSIRIWEKRYSLFSPVRSETNIRSYTDNDLKKLLNVAHLNREGYKISKIADMSLPLMQSEVLKTQEGSRDIEVVIERMIVAVIDLNEYEFDRVLTELLYDYDFEILVIDYLFPFLDRIGVLWQTGSVSPAQEHFISNLIRSKLIVATDRLTAPAQPNGMSFLLYLREGELHEFGLLFANYLLRKYGFRTVYLGQSVPAQDLIKVQDTYKADYLFTSLINSNIKPSVNAYIEHLVQELDYGKLILTGHLSGDYKGNSNRIIMIETYRELIRYIKQL